MEEVKKKRKRRKNKGKKYSEPKPDIKEIKLTKLIVESTYEQKETIKEKQKINLNILLLLFSIIITITILILFIPKIELIGNNNISISYKIKYTEPGYKAKILNKDVTKKVTITSNIENGVIGNYYVEYSLKYLGINLKKRRNISIIDEEKPIIKIDSDTIEVCPNQLLPEIKYSAYDEYDGNITNKVIKDIKDEEISLYVGDSSNNKNSVNIKIDRSDKTKPELNLKGNSVVYLNYGNRYYEPGYTAKDNCSGDLTDKVTVTGSVGKNIGTYWINYEVEDDFKNKTTITRTVIVKGNLKNDGWVNNGTIYLTFDDGPNWATTSKILDVLKEEGVKATFFVTTKGSDDLIRRMYNEGHTVALHTSSHEYSYIYSSVDNYYKDLNQVSERVKRITGEESKIIRFPGGSSNTISRNYKIGIMTELAARLTEQGYRYYDWNIDSMDTSSAWTSDDVYYNVTSRLNYNRANMVLMHDTKTATANAIKDIITFGKNNGYTFNKIDMTTYMIRHTINN